MLDTSNLHPPANLSEILQATAEQGFAMASEPLTGALLRTLAAAKPGGAFLEMGTGTGLSTAWILDGMTDTATLISVDNDATCVAIAGKHLRDPRLQLHCTDGEKWLLANAGLRFDFIFADTWHGKYLMLNEALTMLNPGGVYFIDDMLPQANWPEGHAEKAAGLITALETRQDLLLTKMNWASGIIIATKKDRVV